DVVGSSTGTVSFVGWRDCRTGDWPGRGSGALDRLAAGNPGAWVNLRPGGVRSRSKGWGPIFGKPALSAGAIVDCQDCLLGICGSGTHRTGVVWRCPVELGS